LDHYLLSQVVHFHLLNLDYPLLSFNLAPSSGHNHPIKPPLIFQISTTTSPLSSCPPTPFIFQSWTLPLK
jgi:hypothetical protein